MSVKHYVRRAISLPPHVVAQKLAGRIKQEVASYQRRKRDIKRPTYAINTDIPNGSLLRIISPISASILVPYADQIACLTTNILKHCFDLLGSGYVIEKHGMQCKGIDGIVYDDGSQVNPDTSGNWLSSRINIPNLKESQHIWRQIDPSYTPMDWHLDFKSGYRWLENTWYLDTQYAYKPGADIKVPWELARMQHLPQLAWAYAVAKGQGAHNRMNDAETYPNEFRNQVLDFIATNPPRFGANWRCTMDVGIRIANWLFTYDLFKAQGMSFDDEFEVVFKHSAYEHGLYITNNLEWSQMLRSNHYLSDIVGLLFVAVNLPRTSETDVWLAFAMQELVNEVGSEFNEDGSNFEGSTSYHRLSAELVTYATALVLALPEDKKEALRRYDNNLHKVNPPLEPAPLKLYPLPGTDQLTPFPSWYFERLEKMAEFTMRTSGSAEHICQIGDNDSGRFLKLMPSHKSISVAKAKAKYLNLADYDGLPDDAEYLLEDQLDHRHLVAAINGFFNRDDFAEFVGDQSFETEIIRNLAGGMKVPYKAGNSNAKAAENSPACKDKTPGQDIVHYEYPDFGLYIYDSPRLHLVVRCGSNGQNGNGGHAHNDQLSIVLSVDGRPIFVDPGTYLYTPMPEKRNLFRSTAMHNTLSIEGKEQNRWNDGTAGLFSMYDQAKARTIEVSASRFIGEHYGFSALHRRTLEVGRTTISGIDECESGGKKQVSFHFAPEVAAKLSADGSTIELSVDKVNIKLAGKPGMWSIVESLYSPAYGWLQKTQVVRLSTDTDKISWRIEVE
ncbi:MAG TPA: alginate lyase family protein [Candidatus Aquicultor sp.]|jgi:hypothetical protein